VGVQSVYYGKGDCSLLWQRRLEKAKTKEKAKALKGKKGILAHLFMKIKEIRRKVR